jgi:hypothetical protein
MSYEFEKKKLKDAIFAYSRYYSGVTEKENEKYHLG